MSDKQYIPCGGCGATDPIDRCLGCRHPFELQGNEDEVEDRPIHDAWTANSEIINGRHLMTPKGFWNAVKALHPESPKGCVWVKANDHFPIRKKVIAKMHIGYLNKDVVGYASSSTGEMITFDWEISTVTLRIGHPELDGLLWLDETTTTAHPREDAAGSGKEEKAFAEWLEENTEIIRDNPKITLYRYCNKMNEWGNYTLDDIYTEYANL